MVSKRIGAIIFLSIIGTVIGIIVVDAATGIEQTFTGVVTSVSYLKGLTIDTDDVDDTVITRITFHNGWQFSVKGMHLITVGANYTVSYTHGLFFGDRDFRIK